MNFQTSKRIMCCLMAALILCCAVVRPIEASASVLATGAVVGFALEPAISAILVALGVTGTVAAFTELTKTISKNVPSEYIIEALDGTEYLSAVSYNDVTYVAQELVEWVQSCLFGNVADVEPSYKLTFTGVRNLTTGTTWDTFWSRYGDYVNATVPDAKFCYYVDFGNTVLPSYLTSFYYFGNSPPIVEEYFDRYIPEYGKKFIYSSSCNVPNDALLISQFHEIYDWEWYSNTSGTTVNFPNATMPNIYAYPASYESVAVGIGLTDEFHSSVPDYETWVFPGIHIIILPEDDPPPETEPEETEPPESEPPESQPAVPPTPSEPTPSEPEPEVTDPVELPDTDPSTPSEPETPEEDEPVVDPNKYETYIPVKFPNEILDPNEVTQPEIQTGNGSERPEIETGNTVEIEDPNRTDTEKPTQPDDDTEWGDPVVWPDFPHVDTPEVPFPGTDNDYTGNENDTSWLTKIGEWIKWLGELIKEWIKWLGEYIVEWLKWLGEIIQLLPDAIAYYLKLMVQWLVEAFKPLFQKLAEWLQPLMDYLLEGLKKLFVPKDGYFDEKINELRQSFPLFDSILALLFDLKSFLLSLGATPPVIYANLSSADGSIYWGPNTVFVDMSWYAPYKPAMDTVLSGLLWLWFAWRMVLNLPGIMNGVSGVWKNPITFTKTSSKEG